MKNTKPADPFSCQSHDEWSKPREDWLPVDVMLPYPCRSVADLLAFFEGYRKNSKELRADIVYWKENSGYWQDSAVVMGKALLSVGGALGVDIHASSVLVEATDCIGAPDHE